MTPQSVGLVRAERRLVEEFYNCPLHVNAGLILAQFLSDDDPMSEYWSSRSREACGTRAYRAAGDTVYN